eukprot:s2738_g6.t1
MAQTELRLDGLGIRKIAEIPPGIKVLSISSNRLKNLGSIVECLTLVEVNLAANKLDEAALAPLAALPALRVLNVSRNHIRDLSPLVSAPALAPHGHAFPALEELNISSNPLSDVTAAMSLQVLRVLTAACLAATTLQCVHCSLEVIDLRSCCLQSISGLQALPYLTELVLDGNALLSCKDVAVHPSLQALRLSHNAIGDISAVQLPFLTELDLASNSLSQAFNLAGAPRLVSLVLRTNQLTSLVQLSALRCLTFLDASQNKIRALEPSLRWTLRPLRVLLLNGNEIHDVEDVAKAMEMGGGLALEHLDLRDNPLCLAFYPFAESLPTWTWEARSSFASFAMRPDRDSPDRERPPLDSVALVARDRYCNRLTSICPSLQSLDGLLVETQVPPGHSFQPASDVDSRSPWLGGTQDEVLYSTPRQSREAKAEVLLGQNDIDSGTVVQPVESIPNKPDASSRAKIATSDAATSPVFRERLDSDMGQMSSLANLGLPPELLAAQRKGKQGSSAIGDTQEMVLAMEVAAAAAAAAVAATGCGSKRPNAEADEARASQGADAAGPRWSPQGTQNQEGARSQGSFVVDLRAYAEKGVPHGVPESHSLSLRATDPQLSVKGTDSVLQTSEQDEKDEKQQVDAHGPMQMVLEEDLMYKGEEFEVQQLHIVDKLERAHQELAKQWQELDVERQKSIEEQEQQRQRIQLFAKEQAELQAGLEIQLESEVQKRYEWETHQQQFLEQQQQRLEDQWQREQEKRKQQWEKEQEEEFSKLQQRFQHLQQQFQERLDSAAQPRARESRARDPLEMNLQKSSELPLEGTRQSMSPEQSRHRTAEDAASTPNPSHVSPEGCLQGCLQGFQKSKVLKDPKEPRPQELQEPLAWGVDAVPRASKCTREASTGTQTAGTVVSVCATEGGMALDTSGTEALAEPRTVATNVEFNKSPREAETKKLKHSVVGRSEQWVASPKAEPSMQPMMQPTPDTLREPLAQLAGSYRGWPAAKAANARNISETDQLGQKSSGHLNVPRYGTTSTTSRTAQQLTELGKAQSKHQELPGSDGAFQRALHGRGIWQLEEREDWSSLKITASLDADGRVVSEEEQTGADLQRLGSPVLGFSPKKEQYLKFLQKEIAAQRAFLRDIKNARKYDGLAVNHVRQSPRKSSHSGPMNCHGNGEAKAKQAHADLGDEGSRPRLEASSERKVHFGGHACAGDFARAKEPATAKSQKIGLSRQDDESAWHCVVSPVNAGVRGALEALISQQAWFLPERPFAYMYSLGRAIQNRALPARQHFDALVSRDAAREGVLSPLGFSQRAFFCDKNSKLSEVIASPFGFGAVYQGMAILLALELRHAERLCYPDTAHLTGRTIVAEIALGRCHTSHTLPVELADLGSKGPAGAVPLVKGLESEYRRGADSVYFPQMGIIAILSPTRALPVFLAEYSREFVGASESKVARTTAG